MDEGKQLKEHFHVCMPLFIALGDEIRLSIIEALTDEALSNRPKEQHGLNVREITERTSLSRPAVSHHLKILKTSGLIDVHREGTSNYYYLSIEDSTRKLMQLGHLLESMLSI